MKNPYQHKKTISVTTQPLSIQDISKVYRVPPILFTQNSTPQHVKLPTLTSNPSFGPEKPISPSKVNSPTPSNKEDSINTAVLAQSVNRITKRDLG